MTEPVFRADLRQLPDEDRKAYYEAIWRTCEHCNPYAPSEACKTCEGNGSYLRVQYSALVIDATDRLEENSTGPEFAG